MNEWWKGAANNLQGVASSTVAPSERSAGAGELVAAYPRRGVMAATPALRRAGVYLALTKPRIVELLLIATLPSMVLAKQGVPPLGLVLATLGGGAAAAGGANAVNMVYDRDIDSVMKRTRRRPLVKGEINPARALTFSIVLEAVGFAVLWRWANLEAALISLGAATFYVFVYTMWLKRSTAQNIVIGGAAGAAPALVAWAAVAGHLAPTAYVLFGMVFLWTPPHFWSLAIRYRDDYSKAKVPMLPAVRSPERVANEIIVYTAALVALSLGLVPVAAMGWLYLITAVMAGTVFLWKAVWLRLHLDGGQAMSLFSYSIFYLTVVFVAAGVDVLVRHG